MVELLEADFGGGSQWNLYMRLFFSGLKAVGERWREIALLLDIMGRHSTYSFFNGHYPKDQPQPAETRRARPVDLPRVRMEECLDGGARWCMSKRAR